MVYQEKLIMRLYDLKEASELTFSGSITPDLIKSKLWLCSELKDLEFSTIYILGSWYGNMAYSIMSSDIPFEKIINVDTDKEVLEKSERLLKSAGLENLESMLKDANTIDYRQVNSDSLIINTSTQDIEGNGWWKNIPKGVLIALQGRDQAKKSFKNIEEFDKTYPMSKTIFLGKKTLEDPSTDYTRFMKIGLK